MSDKQLHGKEESFKERVKHNVLGKVAWDKDRKKERKSYYLVSQGLDKLVDPTETPSCLHFLSQCLSLRIL